MQSNLRNESSLFGGTERTEKYKFGVSKEYKPISHKKKKNTTRNQRLSHFKNKLSEFYMQK